MKLEQIHQMQWEYLNIAEVVIDTWKYIGESYK